MSLDLLLFFVAAPSHGASSDDSTARGLRGDWFCDVSDLLLIFGQH
jgi:hypothetical protein